MARTTPIRDRPRIAGNVSGKSFCLAPERIFQSIGFTLAATAAINTASPLTCGSGTLSSNISFSGPPYSCRTTAFITLLLLGGYQCYSSPPLRSGEEPESSCLFIKKRQSWHAVSENRLYDLDTGKGMLCPEPGTICSQ